MKKSTLFLFLSLFAVGAWAQAALSRDAALERRRAELRSALQAARVREAPDKNQMKELTTENFSVSRQLSEQERADLRQQLRQQRRDATLNF
ncbi:MAG: hypothetical protein V4713_05130 [Pseudomonadota bacterium]